MSVYTTVTLSQAQTLASQYGLTVKQLIPIQAGIENTNYFLQLADDSEVVLTLFEEMNLNSINELIPLLTYLKQQDLPVAAPFMDQQEQYLHFMQNKPVQIAPKLQGQHPLQPSQPQIQQMAKMLAELHVGLQNYPLHRHNNHGQQWWEQAKNDMQTQLDEIDQQLMQDVFNQFKQIQAQYPDRPMGLIHGDLFRDNTLFIDNHMTGLLDFSELSFDEWLLDIAICLNDFCSDWPQVSLKQNYAQAFVDSYHQIRSLTDDEQQALPVYLAMAACRFWLSRLQVQQRNHHEARTGVHILQKDPAEMRAMLQDRLQSPFLYLIE